MTNDLIGNLEIQKEFGYIKVKGKYYEADTRNGNIHFKEVKNATTKIKKAKEMAKKLENSLDRKAVLTESIMKLEPNEFETLHKALFKSKKTYKPKTREHHCVDMKVGNFILPIVD